VVQTVRELQLPGAKIMGAAFTNTLLLLLLLLLLVSGVVQVC
jgi:hypothetical protein